MFGRLYVTCHVVEIDSHSLSSHELNALDSDLHVFLLLLYLVFVDTALLGWLVNLFSDDLLEVHFNQFLLNKLIFLLLLMPHCDLDWLKDQRV